jgi:hypothetical protein
MPCSQTPVESSRPDQEDDLVQGSRGSLAAFASCQCLSPAQGRCLAASRREDAAFRKYDYVGFHDGQYFRGSITRPVRSLSTLRSFPSRSPSRTATQDSLASWGSAFAAPVYLRLGSLVKFQLSFTSLPPHPGFAWRTIVPWLRGCFALLLRPRAETDGAVKASSAPRGARLPLARAGEAEHAFGEDRRRAGEAEHLRVGAPVGAPKEVRGSIPLGSTA